MQVLQTAKIPILTYHSVDESGSVISTAPVIFRRQMKFLSEQNYTVLALNSVVKLLFENRPIPPKTIVITFDDGFQNFYTEVFPVLSTYGFMATVFLVTDFCGKYNDWQGNPPELPLSKMLSWDEIRELDTYGIEFGSHTRTHPDLTKISAEKFENEIVESKAVIEDLLGCRVTTFAYPFGKFNSAVKQFVKETFEAACSTNLGKVQTGSDFYSLERIDSYYLVNPKIFNSLSTKGFDRYLAVRQFMRSLKGRVLNN